MSDDQTRLIRERLETWKQRSITYKNWIYLVIATLFAVSIIWTLWSFKKAQDMTGATNAKLGVLIDETRALVSKANEKLDAIDVTKVNDIADSVKAQVDGIGPTQAELSSFIAEARRQLKGRMETADSVLLSVRGVADETKAQIKNNGESATKALNGLTEVEAKLGTAVKTADDAIATQSAKLGRTIDSINKRIDDQRIDDFMASLSKTGGNVEKITANLALISGNFEAASQQAPEIAAPWKKMMQTSSRYQKYLIIARIIGLVGPIFGPLVP